ncbi:MAG: nucleotidyltransferase domain-containing protein [Anaerolineae bacterium]|nr:nucleotidyltransferase domain-containing protein [Anaerolineae bacterium]
MTNEIMFEQLTRYRKKHAVIYGIERLGVFGSTAQGNDEPESDVDIVVELAKPDLLILVGIKQELEEILDRPVDVVRYRENMNQFLKQRIDRNVIYV